GPCAWLAHTNVRKRCRAAGRRRLTVRVAGSLPLFPLRGAAEQICYITERGHSSSSLVIIPHVLGVVLLADRTGGQPDLLLCRIQFEDLELQRLAGLHRAFGLLYSFVAQFGYMTQTFYALFELDECTEAGKSHYFASDHVTQFVRLEEPFPGI